MLNGVVDVRKSEEGHPIALPVTVRSRNVGSYGKPSSRSPTSRGDRELLVMTWRTGPDSRRARPATGAGRAICGGLDAYGCTPIRTEPFSWTSAPGGRIVRTVLTPLVRRQVPARLARGRRRPWQGGSQCSLR